MSHSTKDSLLALFLVVFMAVVFYTAYTYCTTNWRHYHPTKQKTEYDNYRPSSHKMPSTYHM